MMMKDTCRKQSAPLHQKQSRYLGHCRGSEPFISIPLLSSECARLSQKALWQKLARHRLILAVAEPERWEAGGSSHCKNAVVYLLK